MKLILSVALLITGVLTHIQEESLTSADTISNQTAYDDNLKHIIQIDKNLPKENYESEKETSPKDSKMSGISQTFSSLYENVSLNTTIYPSNETTNDTKKNVKCKAIDRNNTEEPAVELINGTRLAKLLTPDSEVTSFTMEADCLAVLFFARVCPFSCQAAPQFNALARVFPDVKMVALDALKHHGINAQYGIVGVPTLKFFHNGRAIARYNYSEYLLSGFSSFIKQLTGLEEPGPIVVLSADFEGPIPSVMEKELDYFLVMSWIFIVVCSIYFFSKSVWWKKIMETIQNNWRESEAQHEHVD